MKDICLIVLYTIVFLLLLFLLFSEKQTCKQTCEQHIRENFDTPILELGLDFLDMDPSLIPPIEIFCGPLFDGVYLGAITLNNKNRLKELIDEMKERNIENGLIAVKDGEERRGIYIHIDEQIPDWYIEKVIDGQAQLQDNGLWKNYSPCRAK